MKRAIMQNKDKYHISLRILHWLMAFMILMLIAVGWRMTGLDKADPLKGTIYSLHKSFGVTVLFLVALRVITRLSTKIPPLPLTIDAFSRHAARALQYVMYGLMFAIPISGYAMSNMFGRAVSWFNLIELPKVFGENSEIGGVVHLFHGYLAYSLLVLVLLHAAGALKHRFIDKNCDNDVLKTML
jgi:cytochrome b561